MSRPISGMSGTTIRVGSLFLDAIQDLKRRCEIEYKKKYGCEKKFTVTEASNVMGVKYFQYNFGVIPIKDVMKILNINGGKKRAV